MRFILTDGVLKEVPAVCSQLIDQTKCIDLLKYCDPNSSIDLCTAKLALLHITHGGKRTFLLDYLKSAYTAGESAMDSVLEQIRVSAYTVSSTLDYAAYMTDVTTKPVDKVIGKTVEAIGFIVAQFLN